MLSEANATVIGEMLDISLEEKTDLLNYPPLVPSNK